MAFHMLVIGHHDSIEALVDDVSVRVGPDTATFIVRTCRTPGDLVDIVRSAVRTLNAPVAVLDLCDHGGSGYLRLGDPIEPPLFAVDIGEEVATALAPLLTHDASVRLLGCDTAVAAEGLALLLALSNAFNKDKDEKSKDKCVVVYGTITTVAAGDFDVGGFKKEREEHYLFSSTQAAELREGQVPPTFDERARALHSWRRKIG